MELVVVEGSAVLERPVGSRLEPVLAMGAEAVEDMRMHILFRLMNMLVMTLMNMLKTHIDSLLGPINVITMHGMVLEWYFYAWVIPKWQKFISARLHRLTLSM